MEDLSSNKVYEDSGVTILIIFDKNAFHIKLLGWNEAWHYILMDKISSLYWS